MIYSQLTRFLLPLVLTLIVQGLSGQFLNGGMARVPRPTQTLAAFGLAWGLAEFLLSPLGQARALALVLAVDHRRTAKDTALRRRRGPGILARALRTRRGTSGELGHRGPARSGSRPWRGRPPGVALALADAYLLIRGLNGLYSGLLLQVRRTEVVSYATVAGITTQIAAVFALLPSGFVQEEPIRLPIAALYAGEMVSLAILAWGHRRYVQNVPTREAAGTLGYLYILQFFWPLALIMAIQGLSRPLINLFVSRGSDGAEALAVLAVVYPLAHMPYGWLNEVRNLPAAFRDAERSLYHIRRFAGRLCRDVIREHGPDVLDAAAGHSSRDADRNRRWAGGAVHSSAGDLLVLSAGGHRPLLLERDSARRAPHPGPRPQRAVANRHHRGGSHGAGTGGDAWGHARGDRSAERLHPGDGRGVDGRAGLAAEEPGLSLPTRWVWTQQLCRIHPAANVSVIGRRRDPVAVSVLRQTVRVGAVFLPLVNETEPVRNHDVAGPGRLRHLELDCLLSGLCRDPHELSVTQTELFRVVGVHDRRARSPSFVPGGITKLRVCVQIHVAAGGHDEGVFRIRLQPF